MENKNTRGSEWRKWDLHVHTPASIENNYKAKPQSDVWEDFISDIESLPSDIKVLGINDYLFIDGYKKVMEYKQKGRLSNIDLILPVLEFRLAKFCGHKQFKRINYHVIFSNEIKPEIIQQQFINTLSSSYKLDPDSSQKSWDGYLTRENLTNLGEKIINSAPEDKRKDYGTSIKEGFNNLNLEISDIESSLKRASTYFEGKYFTAIGKTEWDELNWDDSSIAEKKTIINSVDFVFTAAESVEQYNKGRKALEVQNVNHFLLDCSDSHSNSNSKNKDRLGNCFTWIKADPTFEGLKQIIYEPETRVRIQEGMPDQKVDYQIIDSISFDNEEMGKQTIFFNQNLNTIIGGRSSGKSILLGCLAYKIDQSKKAKLGNDRYNTKIEQLSEKQKVTVKWRDKGGMIKS